MTFMWSKLFMNVTFNVMYLRMLAFTDSISWGFCASVHLGKVNNS